MTKRLCEVSGCGGRHRTRGLCPKHYARLRRHGSPLGGRSRSPGTEYVKRNGYVAATKNGKWQLEHIRVAEAALGRALPRGAQVHHVNENKTDNRPHNLVICQSAAYHGLLHRRANALDACGHADWRRCHHCGNYDSPENLRISTSTVYHLACRYNYNKSRSVMEVTHAH